MRLDHFAVGVADLDAAAVWYRDVIGLRQVAADGPQVYLGCGSRPSFDLVLEEGEPGLRHVAYGTFDAEEFAAATRRIEVAGVARLDRGFPEYGIADAVAFVLPGGHVVRVVLRKGQDRYPNLSQWAPDGSHSPREIDHVNIAVQDVDATVEALRLTLQLELSDLHYVDRHGNVGAWMRAGDRHHDFAIIRNRTDGLHHIAYQVPDASALIAFADRLAIAGTRAEYGIGRHSPGSNLFLYVRDPSGNRVELTADMAIIPPGTPHGVWEGTDPSIVNSLAPYTPPKPFWEITSARSGG